MAQRHLIALRSEVREIKVVHDLGDQIVEAFDQRGAGVGITGHAKRFEHQLAELVRGADGGGIEIGERVPQPAAPLVAFGGAAGQQVGDQVVGRP